MARPEHVLYMWLLSLAVADDENYYDDDNYLWLQHVVGVVDCYC